MHRVAAELPSIAARAARHPWRIAGVVGKRTWRSLRLPPDAVRFERRIIRPTEGQESRLSVMWVDSISPGDIVADIGSQHGQYALYAARKLKEEGSVFAFEPYGPNVEHIYRNITANRFKCITVVHAGLSDNIGVELLYLSPKSASLTHYAGTPDGHPDTSFTVGWTLTIDSYFGALGVRPDVLKIDVDGDELRVLRGGEKVLRGSGARIFLENHYTSDYAQEKVLELLSDIGFVVDMDEPKGDGTMHRHVVGVFE